MLEQKLFMFSGKKKKLHLRFRATPLHNGQVRKQTRPKGKKLLIERFASFNVLQHVLYLLVFQSHHGYSAWIAQLTRYTVDKLHSFLKERREVEQASEDTAHTTSNPRQTGDRGTLMGFEPAIFGSRSPMLQRRVRLVSGHFSEHPTFYPFFPLLPLFFLPTMACEPDPIHNNNKQKKWELAEFVFQFKFFFWQMNNNNNIKEILI